MPVLFRDQRVINFRERPKSEDFNAAQSMATRNLQSVMQDIYSGGALWKYGPGAFTGFDGPHSMRVRASGTNRKVILDPGLAFANVPQVYNVGGIQGVSDYGTAKLAYNGGERLVDIPAAPPSGFCRRDLIAIKPVGYLTEYEPTDIFNPTTLSFGAPVSQPKTYRWDLQTEAVEQQTLPAADYALATSPLVVLVGQSVPYIDPDSWLSAPIPTLPPNYLAVAVVNSYSNNAGILQSDIADKRILVSAGGAGNRFTIRAKLGSFIDDYGQCGYVESYESITPGSVTPRFIVRNVFDAVSANQLFTVDIFQEVKTSANPRVHISGTVVNATLNGPNIPFALGSRPVMIIPDDSSQQFNREVDQAYKTALNSEYVTPGGAAVNDWLAIGQLYTRVQFILATMRADSSGAVSIETGARTFGVDSFGSPILRPDVQLDVNWYPFSYND